jgi:hypothetical protein
MALPYRTTGSLRPTFVPARSVVSQSSTLMPLHTLRTMSDRAERTFVLLRYSLGGDRPSQTTHHTWSPIRIEGPRLERQAHQGGISRLAPQNWRSRFKASHLSYTVELNVQCKAIVKVHGVFPSSRGYTASSQRFQFH